MKFSSLDRPFFRRLCALGLLRRGGLTLLLTLRILGRLSSFQHLVKPVFFLRRPCSRRWLQRAKAIGRIAYVHAREGTIIGNAPVDGEEKRLTEYEDSGISIELAAPFRPHARPDEFSRLPIRVHGEKVFEIRWDKAAAFKVVHLDQGATGSERCARGRSRSRSSRSVSQDTTR